MVNIARTVNKLDARLCDVGKDLEDRIVASVTKFVSDILTPISKENERIKEEVKALTSTQLDMNTQLVNRMKLVDKKMSDKYDELRVSYDAVLASCRNNTTTLKAKEVDVAALQAELDQVKADAKKLQSVLDELQRQVPTAAPDTSRTSKELEKMNDAISLLHTDILHHQQLASPDNVNKELEKTNKAISQLHAAVLHYQQLTLPMMHQQLTTPVMHQLSSPVMSQAPPVMLQQLSPPVMHQQVASPVIHQQLPPPVMQ